MTSWFIGLLVGKLAINDLNFELYGTMPVGVVLFYVLSTELDLTYTRLKGKRRVTK